MSEAPPPPGRVPERPADDLDEVSTPLSRLREHAGRWLAVIVAVAMVVPFGMWLVDEIRFRVSGAEVVETVRGELSGQAIADAVLLVRSAGCTPGTGASGSAFVAETERGRMLLTNRHVVERARQISVRTLDGAEAVRVVGVRISDRADVAVLEVADEASLPPALALRPEPPTPGTAVHLIGFPAAMPFTTGGEVVEASADRLLLRLEVDPGASGSPVVDDDGRVVGQVFAVTGGGRGVATPTRRVLDAATAARPHTPCGDDVG